LSLKRDFGVGLLINARCVNTLAIIGDEDPGVECDGLNVKCPSKVHVLKTWSPAGSAILGGDLNFQKGSLAGGLFIRGMLMRVVNGPWSLPVSLYFLAIIR
jgi:hypothetical protein